MRDEQTLLLTLGASLRERRLARGMSLGDMARATRIGASYLDALESDRLAELPAPVFIRGFIRAYCEQLDERPDEYLRRYRHVLGERDDVQPQPAVHPRRGPQLGPISISLILVAILGGGLVLLTQAGRTHREAPERVAKAPAEQPAPPAGDTSALRASQPATPASGPPAAVPAPSGTREPPPAGSQPAPQTGVAAGQPAAEAPPAPAPGPPASLRGNRPASRPLGTSPLKLTVRAVEQTWLRVQTDDGRAVSELLEPGTVREWISDNRFVLTVGNAAGIELSLNDRPMPPLGGRGVVRRVEIPEAGAAEASTSR